jgi:hypothetical protein
MQVGEVVTVHRMELLRTTTGQGVQHRTDLLLRREEGGGGGLRSGMRGVRMRCSWLHRASRTQWLRRRRRMLLLRVVDGPSSGCS